MTMPMHVSTLSAAVLAAILAPGPRAAPGETEIVELDEAEVFVEFNSTDGDFGIQFFWDGDPWRSMTVRGPVASNGNGEAKTRTVLAVRAKGNVKEQGLAECFFESDEPSLDELSMEEFLERFPEGAYEFRGRGNEPGVQLEGEAEFTHTLPAPPSNLSPAEGAMVDAGAPLVASFSAVTQDLDGQPLAPELYEIVVETEDDILRVFSMTIEGDEPFPSATVPPEFLAPDTEYKLEVIVQEESGNRTIAETTFTTLP